MAKLMPTKVMYKLLLFRKIRRYTIKLIIKAKASKLISDIFIAIITDFKSEASCLFHLEDLSYPWTACYNLYGLKLQFYFRLSN
jgi:hypothetical protein